MTSCLYDSVLHLDGLVELQQKCLGMTVEDEGKVANEELFAEIKKIIN